MWPPVHLWTCGKQIQFHTFIKPGNRQFSATIGLISRVSLSKRRALSASVSLIGRQMGSTLGNEEDLRRRMRRRQDGAVQAGQRHGSAELSTGWASHCRPIGATDTVKPVIHRRLDSIFPLPSR